MTGQKRQSYRTTSHGEYTRLSAILAGITWIVPRFSSIVDQKWWIEKKKKVNLKGKCYHKLVEKKKKTDLIATHVMAIKKMVAEFMPFLMPSTPFFSFSSSIYCCYYFFYHRQHYDSIPQHRSPVLRCKPTISCRRRRRCPKLQTTMMVHHLSFHG